MTGYSLGAGGNYDAVTIKYSSSGVGLWTNRFNAPANADDYAYASALDAAGNVVIAGYTFNGVSFDSVALKYSAAGVPLWTNYYDGPTHGSDAANAVAVGTNGNAYVVGYTTGGSSSADYLVLAYSSAGARLWTNTFNGSGNDYDEGRAVAADGLGNVIVTGFSQNGTSFDFTTLAYSSAGQLLWSKNYNGAADGDDLPLTTKSLVVLPDTTVGVAGESDGNFAGGVVYDFSVVKYIQPVFAHAAQRSDEFDRVEYQLQRDGSRGKSTELPMAKEWHQSAGANELHLEPDEPHAWRRWNLFGIGVERWGRDGECARAIERFPVELGLTPGERDYPVGINWPEQYAEIQD